MRNLKRVLTALGCAFALLANGAGAAAQQQEKAPKREADVLVPRGVVTVTVPPMPGDGPQGYHFEVAPPDGPDALGFSFVASEMSFDSKVVAGAAYSAEAVTETVQTLADGNRITRKSTTLVYRDGDGRTRRDQTLAAIGPWATADDPPRTILINDPIAGVNYVLDPRTSTARRINGYSFHVENFKGGANGAGGVFVMRAPEPGESAVLPARVPAPDAAKAAIEGGMLNGRASKRVSPVYPPVAKAAGAQGLVVVSIVVNEEGVVESAKAVSGHPLLQSAAVEAAQQWRFAPTRLGGKPVKVTGKLSFSFVLSKEDREPESYPRQQGAQADVLAPAKAPAVQSNKESLGKQVIEGVEAEGTRLTVTIPAGAIGNERAINIVTERWYSPELQQVVMSRHSDPRFGETTYRLTNINRGEQDRSLFEVPQGYTVKEGGVRMRGPAPVRVRKEQ